MTDFHENYGAYKTDLTRITLFSYKLFFFESKKLSQSKMMTCESFIILL